MLLALVVTWLLLVWPTSWRYDRVTIEGDTFPVRIHRVSGRAQMLTPDEGWVPMGRDRGPSREDESTQGSGEAT